MKQETDRILALDHYVREELKKRLPEGLPKRGHGAYYNIKLFSSEHHYTWMNDFRLIEEMAGPLRWGARRDVSIPTRNLPVMDNYPRVPAREFLDYIQEVEYQGTVTLSPIEFFLMHWEIRLERPRTPSGWWEITSSDFETVTSELKKDFALYPGGDSLPSLQGQDLESAIPTYLDSLLQMYRASDLSKRARRYLEQRAEQ